MLSYFFLCIQASFLFSCSSQCLTQITSLPVERWTFAQVTCVDEFFHFFQSSVPFLIIVFIIDFGRMWGWIKRKAAPRESCRVYVCVCVYESVSVLPTYIWFVQVHICFWKRVLLTELSFRDAVSFHFNAWLVNDCLCKRYDVFHSRRAFSVCSACVCVCTSACYFGDPLTTSMMLQGVLSFFLSEAYTHTVYTVHTHTLRGI